MFPPSVLPGNSYNIYGADGIYQPCYVAGQTSYNKISAGWVNNESDTSPTFWQLGYFDSLFSASQQTWTNDWVFQDNIWVPHTPTHTCLKLQVTMSVSDPLSGPCNPDWFRTYIFRIPFPAYNIQVYNTTFSPLYSQVLYQLQMNNLKITADSSRVTTFTATGTGVGNYILRIKENPLGDSNDVYGSLTVLSSTSDSIAVQYHHPVYLDTSAGVSSRCINLQLYDPSGNTVIESCPLDIIRPPLLFIHGLWSNGASFDGLQNYLLATGMYAYESEVQEANYPSDRYFAQNEPIVESQKNGLLCWCRSENISVGKIDVVAHSMGGILTRLYTTSGRYSNDINKIITCNTPHSGAQTANVLRNGTIYSNGIDMDLYFYLGMDVTKGAVSDLEVNSGAILYDLNGSSVLANQPKIWKTAIVTTAVPSDYTTYINPIINAATGWDAFIYTFFMHRLNKAPTIFDNYWSNNVFSGNANDFVVPDTSQQGGLPGYFTYDPQCHMGSPCEPHVESEIKYLLCSNPATVPIFTTDGYNPPVLTPPSVFFKPRTKADTVNSSLTITSPVAGSTYNSGDTVEVDVTGSSDINSVMMCFGNQSIQPSFVVDSFSSGTFKFQIPAEVIGRLNIMAIGFDTSGNAPLDTTYIIVGSGSATLNSIQIQEPLLYIPVNDTESVYTEGFFSDGSEKNLTYQSGLTYTLKHNLAAFEAPNNIIGLQAGTDTLIVSYNGISDSVPVQIVQTNIITRVHNIQQSIVHNCYPNPFNNITTIEYYLQRARPALRRRGQAVERRDLSRHRAEGALHFVDLRAEIALDRLELLARAAHDPIERRAGLAQPIENLAEFVAHPLARRAQRGDRSSRVAPHGLAQACAGTLDLVGNNT